MQPNSQSTHVHVLSFRSNYSSFSIPCFIISRTCFDQCIFWDCLKLEVSSSPPSSPVPLCLQCLFECHQKRSTVSDINCCREQTFLVFSTIPQLFTSVVFFVSPTVSLCVWVDSIVFLCLLAFVERLLLLSFVCFLHCTLNKRPFQLFTFPYRYFWNIHVPCLSSFFVFVLLFFFSVHSNCSEIWGLSPPNTIEQWDTTGLYSYPDQTRWISFPLV